MIYNFYKYPKSTVKSQSACALCAYSPSPPLNVGGVLGTKHASRGHFRPFPTISGHFRPSPTISVYPRPFPAILGHFRPSPTISGHPWPFPAILGHFQQSPAILAIPGHPRPFPAIPSNSRTFLAIPSHFRPSLVISGHPRPFPSGFLGSISLYVVLGAGRAQLGILGGIFWGLIIFN